MDKVILKAVFSTLMAIIVLCGVMTAALVFIYPSTMMGLAYDVGLDNASAWFAGRAYNQLDNVYYIAFATEVSIGTGDMEKIDEYGSKFILDESFGEYCSRMDEQTSGIGNSYAQYVYGQVCMAKYRLGKGEEAVELSFSINEDCFPPKNAAAAVLLIALQRNGQEDLPVIENILARLKALQEEQKTNKTFSDEDLEYLESMIKLTEMRMENFS